MCFLCIKVKLEELRLLFRIFLLFYLYFDFSDLRQSAYAGLTKLENNY